MILWKVSVWVQGSLYCNYYLLSYLKKGFCFYHVFNRCLSLPCSLVQCKQNDFAHSYLKTLHSELKICILILTLKKSLAITLEAEYYFSSQTISSFLDIPRDIDINFVSLV